jgi:hypothetical protein
MNQCKTGEAEEDRKRLQNLPPRREEPSRARRMKLLRLFLEKRDVNRLGQCGETPQFRTTEISSPTGVMIESCVPGMVGVISRNMTAKKRERSREGSPLTLEEPRNSGLLVTIFEIEALLEKCPWKTSLRGGNADRPQSHSLGFD